VTSGDASRRDARRCATAARRRDDPLPGTAPPARRWLLIEHPGPWEVEALHSRHLVGGIVHELSAAARTAGARVLLIRRPGRRAALERPAWAVVDHRDGMRWGLWRQADDLLRASDLLTAPMRPGGPQEPLLLVCTHGKHDVCCAVRGRPVAQALSLRWPEATWECSHVGGDRFAPNVLVLPEGAYYGGIDAASAVQVVQDHLDGAVAARYLRGISTQPPVVQAALVDALGRWGPAGLGSARLVEQARLDANSWRVRLTGALPLPATMEAWVERSRRPAELLTCRAEGATSAYAYAVRWVSPP
jgi:hypothetical protein